MRQCERNPLALYNRVAQIIFVSVFFAGTIQAGTNFYVDPDWTGAKSGTQEHPFAMLNKSAWQKINTALAHSDVTIYFSALKADGVTQQSRTLFVQCRRTDPSTHRLTLDGYSFYNSDETTPNWLANPDSDISHAYLDGKVFKIVGGTNPIDSNMALGWTRVDGNDGVTNNSTTYTCIESHVASSDNAPGTGPNWTLYWDAHTPLYPACTVTTWRSGVTYRCYVKQNNITIRGFEITNRRSAGSGDNLIWEYNWIHDTDSIGPALNMPDYTTYPDSSAAKVVQRPSTNITLRNFRIERTYGEGIYMGSLNPDAPAELQSALGNQHSYILIENFLIDQPGINGAQGDGIDSKNGITYLTIRLGEIKRFGNGAGCGIIVPMSATNMDQHILIERVFIHDATNDGTTAKIGIYAATDQTTATSLYGFNGVTIRNNIVANCRRGIQFSGDLSINRPAVNGSIFNNTVYNINPDAGLGVNTNVSHTIVENNFVFGGTDPRGQIGSTGVTSDYNAHDGNWISANEGVHTLALSTTQALAAVVNAKRKDFHPCANSALKGKALTISDFSDDFYRRSRAPGNWNIGAVQMSGDSPAASLGKHVVP
jgi:hypothetical protein